MWRYAQVSLIGSGFDVRLSRWYARLSIFGYCDARPRGRIPGCHSLIGVAFFGKITSGNDKFPRRPMLTRKYTTLS